MGTFERSYEVDGERFELYAQAQDGDTVYQLVDEESLPVGGPFSRPPDEEMVTSLVRAVNALTDSAA